MSGRREQLAARARIWIEYARADLRAARILIAAPGLPAWPPAFHAQQCAEKALKSFLVMYVDELPLTHNLQRLLDECAAFTKWPADLQAAATLSAFGVGMKYPNQADAVTRDVAEEAIQIAAKVLAAVESALKYEGIDLT